MRTFLVSLLSAASLSFALACAACSSTPANDPRSHYTKPDVGSSPCRVDEIIATFTDGANSYEICTPVGCAGTTDCPVPASGNATVECYHPPGVTQCRLRCSAGGITCPDGMVCVATADSSLSACAYPTTVDAGL